MLCIPLSFLRAEEGYRVLKTLRVGGEGSWDHLAVDSAGKRLYITRDTHVLVVDAGTGATVGDIPGTSGAHSIALAPELNRGFISNGKADTATIFDLKTLKTLKQVKTGNEPDAVVYDPVSRRVFVFNRKSNDATVFEADSGKAVGTVGLGGQTECAVADGKGRVFINNMDISALAVIDSKTLAIVNRYSLYPGNKPAGLAYDPEHARLFAACFSRSMVVVDAEGDGRYLDSFPIGTQAQSAVFDPATQTAFSSNAGGTVTVARETSPGKFEVIQTIATQPGAGTMALDPGSHRLYVPVKDKNGFAVLVIGK